MCLSFKDDQKTGEFIDQLRLLFVEMTTALELIEFILRQDL